MLLRRPLIRNKKVFCYGLPFYAGWGLTIDRESFKRPKRQLTLHELIAGTLIVYAQYRSLFSHKPIQVEQAIDELVSLKQKKPTIWTNLLKPWLNRK